MKIRHGFVSNSSSSSFIVGFERIPISVEDLQKMLFGNESGLVNPYAWGDGDVTVFPGEAVSQRVWSDMQDKKEVADAAVLDAISSGWFPGPNYPDFPHRHAFGTEEWRRDAIREYFEDVVRPLFAGLHVFMFEYGDHDTAMETAMEHGNLFRRLPHLVVSNH